MTRVPGSLLLVSFIVMSSAGSGSALAGCEDIYPAMALGPFPADAPTTTPLFYAADDAGSGSFNVRWTGLACGRTDVGVDAEYFDTPGSAADPSDYVIPEGQRTPRVCEAGCPTQGTVTFPIPSEVATDQATETFTIGLRDPAGGSLDPPSSVPFVLVDAAGPSRVGFDSLEYIGTESVATITVAVWRAGSAPSRVEVPYTVGPGGTSPATDADFTVTSPNPLVFEPNERLELITLSVVNDNLTEGRETLDLTLQTPTGAALDTAATKTVSIDDNEESISPSSRLHHPRNGKTYVRDAYQLREIHVFTSDQGGSGVVTAEMALSRTLRGGRCEWFRGKRFRRGNCGEPRWVSMETYEPDFFYLRMQELEPSVGGPISSYTAYSRAIDGAGNMERELVKGRNENTFEVKAPRGGSGR
jgi:hypothetical protein